VGVLTNPAAVWTNDYDNIEKAEGGRLSSDPRSRSLPLKSQSKPRGGLGHPGRRVALFNMHASSSYWSSSFVLSNKRRSVQPIPCFVEIAPEKSRFDNPFSFRLRGGGKKPTST